MPRSIPLVWRAPNPPPVLIGRDAEVQRLADRMRRAPVVVVHGPSDIGKLATVLHVLHKRFKSRVERALYVRPAEADEPIAATIVRALAALAGLDKIPPGDVAEVALDLAEAESACVIVDGCREWAFAEMVARYARNARWILLGTAAPPPALVAHEIAIGPLSVEALQTLSMEWFPDLDVQMHAVAAAGANGSPWRLRARVADVESLGPAALFAVSDEARDALAILALVEQPLPLAVIGTTSSAVDQLVRAGLAVASPSGFALHAATRALLDRDPGAAAVRHANGTQRAVAERLAATGEPHLVCEAVRLAITSGDAQLVAAWLDEHGPAMIDGGLARRLARSIFALPAPELARWRLRVAVEIGDGDRLVAMRQDITAIDRELWAEGLLRAGLRDEAIAAASDIRTDGASLVVARALGSAGRYDEALARLQHVDTPAAHALAARLHALAGQATSARAALARIDLATAAAETLYTVASAQHELGELDACEATLDALARRIAGDPSDRFIGRRASLVRAAVLLDRGQLARATELLDDVARGTTQQSVHRPFLVLLGAQRELARGHAIGDLAGSSGYIGAWAAALTAREALVDPARPLLPIEGEGLWPVIARLHRARVELRAGQSCEVAELRDPPFEAWIAARALAWERALVAGDGAAALAVCREAIAACEQTGFVCWRDQARAGAGDAEVLLEQRSVELDPAVLERDAAGRGAPARRARWWLGYPTDADAIDHVVCKALRRSAATVICGATERWRAGWGIDAEHRRVWLSDGRHVELADKPQLWRLLAALAASPVGISKEALVMRTWDVAYHPLRHDKRLQNAIHKLRKLVEDDPADPRRIPTTADGYRLGDSEPVRLWGQLSSDSSGSGTRPNAAT